MKIQGWLDDLLNRVSIGTRLAGAFVIILILLGVAAGVSLQQTRTIGESSQSLVSEQLRTISLAQTAHGAAQTGATLLYSLLLLEDRDRRAEIYRRIDAAATVREKAILEIVAAIPADDREQVVNRVLKTRDAFVPIFDEAVDAVELDRAFARKYMLQTTMPALENMLAALDALVAYQTRRTEGVVQEIRAHQARATSVSTRLGLLCLALAMALALVITRSLVRPLARTTEFAIQIADGRLDAPLPAAGRDEVGVLVRSLETMRQGIAQREQRISQLAYYDATTGLPNRALLQDRLRQSLNVAARTAQPLAIMLLDLDRFRAVNDVLGHPAGDVLLQQVAERLQDLLRRDSDSLARMGGDEFAVLLPVQGADDAVRMARRILDALSRPVALQSQLIDVGASIGIAVFPEHGSRPELLLARADTAMYAAKDTGNGYALFVPAMEHSGNLGLSLLGELRQALQEDEFQLFLQPKIRLSDGRCTGTEGLIRWLPRDRPAVSPDKFIPFAEQTGFIKHITRWVLRRACQIASRHQSTSLRFGISVNVSARDLTGNDFPAVVAEILSETSLHPDLLTLEITESGMMADPAQALVILTALNAMGVGLSIDDFGTGYSSLAYLKRLPVKELKIDQTFVRNLPKDEDDNVIVRSTIELAHNLGLGVVAEGVETEHALNRLREFGCDSVQGYLYSRPLPEEAFLAWLRARSNEEMACTARRSPAFLAGAIEAP